MTGSRCRGRDCGNVAPAELHTLPGEGARERIFPGDAALAGILECWHGLQEIEDGEQLARESEQ